MKQQDYTPYLLTAEQPDFLQLQLKRTYKVLRFVTFRIIPLFLLLCLAVTHEALSKEMPEWFFSVYFLFIAGLSVYLLFYKYNLGITLTKTYIKRRINSFYFSWNETEIINQDDSISVVKERGGRSVYWAFYLVQKSKRTRIMHIPVFLSENLDARNNFIKAFEQICGLKTEIADT